MNKPQIPLTQFSGWDYRVVKSTHKVGNETFNRFEIKEIYYDHKNEPYMWIDEEASPFGQSLEDLKADLDLMTKSLEKEVLLQEDLNKLYEEEEKKTKKTVFNKKV